MKSSNAKPDHTIVVHLPDGQRVLTASSGQILRAVLQAHDIGLYGTLSKWVNCGGRGVCATCGVWVNKGPAPVHWHDKLAMQWGYPRLSCQIQVEEDLEITILSDKIMWGKLIPSHSKKTENKFLEDTQS